MPAREGEFDKAAAEYRKAIANGLGNVLSDWDEEIVEYRTSIALDPKAATPGLRFA
jgi:hypothetical protein